MKEKEILKIKETIKTLRSNNCIKVIVIMYMAIVLFKV